MAIFNMKLEVLVDDKTHLMTAKVKARSDADERTVGVKALNSIVPMYFADSLDVMDFVRSLKRESFDWEDFADSIEQELDIKMSKPSVLF